MYLFYISIIDHLFSKASPAAHMSFLRLTIGKEFHGRADTGKTSITVSVGTIKFQSTLANLEAAVRAVSVTDKKISGGSDTGKSI